jgi:hypothetical protein
LRLEDTGVDGFHQLDLGVVPKFPGLFQCDERVGAEAEVFLLAVETLVHIRQLAADGGDVDVQATTVEVFLHLPRGLEVLCSPVCQAYFAVSLAG